MLAFLLPMLAQDWSTHYERSNFVETGRYAEAVDYCRRLARASRNARVVEYGRSPEGRPMIALLMSSSGEFDAERMRRSKKPLVFIENGIHSGEIEGKDASLILARDMLITGKRSDLLRGVNVVMVPVFGLDAHERFGPYHRINQNGPREMGWRANAQNLNLNRDFIKADAGEMRAQLSLIQRYRPDFFFDNHTTDGADHQYTLMLGLPWGPGLPSATAQWQRNLYESVKRSCDAAGFLTAPYFGMVDRGDPSKGITIDDFGPRFSNGYLSVLGRPSMLVETHVLKPYRPRVEATYEVMVQTIRRCIDQATELKALNAAADRGLTEGEQVVLSSRLTEQRDPILFKAWEYTPYQSEVSGAMVAKWKHTPIDVPTWIRQTFAPNLTVKAPAAYVVPSPWAEVIDRLSLHGIRFRRLSREVRGTFDSFAFSDVSFPRQSFEGRFQPSYKVAPIAEPRVLPAGSVVVPVDQPNAELLVHLLEPEGPDSLVRWGFFNAIFERKEYAEDYALEPVAKEMLARDPKLRAEFEERLKDPTFAASPAARLSFLYDRSLWADNRLNKYPVVRLTEQQLKSL